MLGYDLTFLTYKLPNFGGFEWEIFPNFGMSEKSEKIETFISENFRDSWFFLTFLTYKLPNFGRFKWEIFPNFGMSEKSEKIETFISENFRSSWFFLTILTYKIFDFDLRKLKWKIFWKLGFIPEIFPIFWL